MQHKSGALRFEFIKVGKASNVDCQLLQGPGTLGKQKVKRGVHYQDDNGEKPKVAGTCNAYEIRAAIWSTAMIIRDCPISYSINLGIFFENQSALPLFHEFAEGVDCCFFLQKDWEQGWDFILRIKEPDDRTAS